MAIEKVSKVVATGFWLYDGIVRHNICIVASNYDRPYEAALKIWEDEGPADYADEPPQGPKPLGPSGWMFEVQPHWFETFNSLEDARVWADAQPWGPVTWEP